MSRGAGRERPDRPRPRAGRGGGRGRRGRGDSPRTLAGTTVAGVVALAAIALGGAAVPAVPAPALVAVQRAGSAARGGLDVDVRTAIAGRWGERLAALAPDEPMAYLELAEEVDDARAVGPAADGDPVAAAERGLARRLFGLAGVLEPRLAPSAARAIADLVVDPRVRRRLLVVAELLEGDRILRGRPPRLEGVPAGRGTAAAPEVLRAISAAIADYRLGDGEAALERLAGLPADAVEAALAPWPGGRAGFEQDCRRRPGGATVRRLLAELSAELRMLEGDGADWAAIVRSGGGVPLEEPDLGDLAGLFGVDASRVLYRDGRWVAP